MAKKIIIGTDGRFEQTSVHTTEDNLAVGAGVNEAWPGETRANRCSGGKGLRS